jgi:outer membrane protein TolC
MFDQDLNRTTLGVAAEIPLGNLGARARLRQALLERAQTRSGQEALRLAIRQDVLDAADAVEQNWLRILSAREEVIRATRTYRAEQLQFGAGVITSTEVLQAALAVAVAQVREIQALRDYQNGLVDLSFATGTILGQSGVIWERRQLPPGADR